MSDSTFGGENRSIAIERDALSSAIISGDGNRVVIYQYHTAQQVQSEPSPVETKIGPNPYKGLLAFDEEDAERYFGREAQISRLWNVFRTLHENVSQIRLLPILGPSGSGKSSLARAGLIPELARRPLPGKKQAQVAILVPGAHPLEALAGVLARVATQDLTPVAKTREFVDELQRTNNTGAYDGLRRIADMLPKIAESSLVVLVDQFEEVYSLCKNADERKAFIENLVDAAADPSVRVSVIVTLRSDFLGETQRHPVLNQLVAQLGLIIPAMTADELQQAIAKPAELAGHPLDEATVNLLVQEAEGREGALPLLQFALTRIWEGLTQGIEPAVTLKQIGGVGGALAGEAQRIYDNLSPEEKEIARRVFLGLVQLGEGAKDTRRRAAFAGLVSHKDSPEQVKQVIGKFAARDVRLITLSSVPEAGETAEVTHEALFEHWRQFGQWLDSSRSDIRFGRRLEEAAKAWQENGRPEGSLWRTPDLDLLEKYYEQKSDNMTPLQVEFFNASVFAEEARKQAAIKAEQDRKRQRQVLIGILSTGLLLTTTATGFAAYQWQSAERGRIEQTAITAKNKLSNYPLQGMVTTISLVGQSRSPFLNFPNQSFPQSILDSLFSAVEISREKNLLKGHQGYVRTVAISTDGQTIVSGGDDGTVRLWNRKGQPLGEPFKSHQGSVISAAISTDGQTILSGGDDGTVRLWNRKGQPLGEPFKGLKGHQGYVKFVSISTDGQTILSVGSDGTVRLWNRKGQLLGEPFKGHQGSVTHVSISADGQTIISGGDDGTIRLWSRKGQPLGEPFKGHQGSVTHVSISADGQTIISGGDDGTIRLWNRKGQPLGEPFKGHQGYLDTHVAISTNGQTIVSGSDDGTVRLWNRKGQLLGEPFKGHEGIVISVAISTDGQTILSSGVDGTIRLWDRKGQPLGALGEPFKGHQGSVRTVAMNTYKQTIISGGDDGTIRLWDRKGQPLGELFKGHQGSVLSLSISTDGQTILSSGLDGTVRLWNRKGQLLGEPFKGHQGPSGSNVAISTDGQTIVSWDLDGTIRLWNREGQPLGEPFKGHQSFVTSVAISTDGQTIVSGSGDNTVRLWNRKGQLLSEPFKGHQNYVRSVAISTDGQTIVSGSDDDTVRLWNRKGQLLSEPFKGHQSRVYSVAISTDGQTIVSGGDDGTIRLWNRKGQPLGEPFKGPQSRVWHVAISSDRQTILSMEDNGTVRLWDIKIDTWLKAACERLQDHPVFKDPKTSEEKGAKATCEPYFR
ncbi:nSTAND1 domain-containing NTPase [Mastigocladopsis repens]|uniref:nSTAND1 domain-containing NTPase n=1 Tax=Mastigocladopsis repens TaxID=221287 RepID=UPI0002F59341|nr:AAA family ATPase [Mastigocladopsis repens]